VRLIPRIAAVRPSFSFASLAYRANAFKTSSGVISGGRLLERIRAVIVLALRFRLFIPALVLFSAVIGVGDVFVSGALEAGAAVPSALLHNTYFKKFLTRQFSQIFTLTLFFQKKRRSTGGTHVQGTRDLCEAVSEIRPYQSEPVDRLSKRGSQQHRLLLLR
jgi:hypothetical protein